MHCGTTTIAMQDLPLRKEEFLDLKPDVSMYFEFEFLINIPRNEEVMF